MNIEQEMYFQLGKLNVQIKHINKSYFLLPMIVRQGVYSLNCNKKRIEFENLFSPNVAENPDKEVLLIVKMIKEINYISSLQKFALSDIQKLILSFDKNANIDNLSKLDFDFDISTLYKIYKSIYNSKNELSNLYTSIIINMFLVKGEYISLPILDIAKFLISTNVDNENDFNELIVNAVKSTISIFVEHKKLVVKHTQIAKQANMKSVINEYEYIIENPVIEIGSMLEDLDMTFATLSKATAILESSGVLTKIAGSQRYRIFKYDALCDLFSK